jgi:hypothetical protein
MRPPVGKVRFTCYRLPMDFADELAQYDYAIDPEQIAETPALPRDSAKLLAYDRSTGNETEDTFLHLDQYLKPGTLLILNDTKVVPARLPSFLPTGGKVDLLWLSAGRTRNTFEALAPRTLDIGATLTFDSLTLTVLDKRDSIYTFRHSGTSTRFRRCGFRPASRFSFGVVIHSTPMIVSHIRHVVKSRDVEIRSARVRFRRGGVHRAPALRG